MMTNPILFWVFALSGLCLVVYYVFVLLASREHSSSGERSTSSPSAEREGISVVVVSRNGLESLRALVPSLLAQKYPKFEIVVVNDRSFDNTDVFLKSVQRNYPTVLRIVTVPQDTTYPWPGRKFAITMGVKAAQYERIVLLDNTAVPAGEHWLDALAERMNRPQVEFLIGCTGMREGGLWAALDFRRSSCDVAWPGKRIFCFRTRPIGAIPRSFVRRKPSCGTIPGFRPRPGASRTSPVGLLFAITALRPR